MTLFSRMMVRLHAFWQDEKGNEVVTWVVIAALAVAIAAVLLGGIGNALNNAVNYISNTIDGAAGT